MHRLTASAVALLVLLQVTQAVAETRNPEISVVGDTRAHYSSETEDTTLRLSEVEIVFLGPLSDRATAEVFIAVHDGSAFEIEEAKVLLDGYLPGGLGLAVGRMFLDFGQLNPVHAHEFPFVNRPLMHSEFFGEDGALDVSVRIDGAATTDRVRFRGTLGAVAGDAISGGHGAEEEGAPAEETEEAATKIGVSGRAEAFARLSDQHSLRVGTSVLHGETDPVTASRSTFVGVDARASLGLGPSRTLTLYAEGIFGALDATDEAAASDPRGFFGSANLRLSRRWNVGGFAEFTTERENDDVRTERFGGFVGLAFLDETTEFRLLGRTTDFMGSESEEEVILQAIFRLGPHEEHGDDDPEHEDDHDGAHHH